MDDQRPWNTCGEAIDLKLEHQNARPDADGRELISCDWELPPFFLGNRFPRTQENVCECTIPLPEESVALAQLAEQASQCDSPEDLEIPAVLQKYF